MINEYLKLLPIGMIYFLLNINTVFAKNFSISLNTGYVNFLRHGIVWGDGYGDPVDFLKHKYVFGSAINYQLGSKVGLGIRVAYDRLRIEKKECIGFFFPPSVFKLESVSGRGFKAVEIIPTLRYKIFRDSHCSLFLHGGFGVYQFQLDVKVDAYSHEPPDYKFYSRDINDKDKQYSAQVGASVIFFDRIEIQMLYSSYKYNYFVYRFLTFNLGLVL